MASITECNWSCKRNWNDWLGLKCASAGGIQQGAARPLWQGAGITSYTLRFALNLTTAQIWQI